MANRRRRETGIRISHDPYGQTAAPGTITARGIRKMRHGNVAYRHLVKNGVYDPFTFFHIVDTLLNMTPASPFKAADLTEYLNKNVDFMVWDSTTVGRVLNDINESLVEANRDEESQALFVWRDWSASYYEIRAGHKAHLVLWRLMEDLVPLCEALRDQEKQGTAPKRLGSPLGSCPSVTGWAGEDAA